MKTDTQHTSHSPDIAIVGGGISGLATAFYLHRYAPSARITIFEKAPGPGGTMRTAHQDGFLFEEGANGFLSNRAETLELIQACGAAPQLLKSSEVARNRYVFIREHLIQGLHRLPDSPLTFLGTDLLSFRDKLRVLGEVRVPPRQSHEEESLRDFGYRRLGQRFTDIFLDAIAAGIHGSTPALLSVDAAFPAVVRLEREYGGLFRGMLKKRRKEAGPGGVLMSFRDGVGGFIRQLAHHLTEQSSVTLLTDTPVAGFTLEPDGHRVRLMIAPTTSAPTTSAQPTSASPTSAPSVTDPTHHSANPPFNRPFDHLILATPAHVSAGYFDPLDRGLAHHLRTIDYSPIAVVGFGFSHLKHPLNGFGFLTTSSSGEPILGALWDSAVFPGRAPTGQHSLRVLVGGQRHPHLPLTQEPKLVRIALMALEKTMGITETPETVFVRRWPQGIPHYAVGHLGKVAAIRSRLLAYPGIHLNSNAYDGVGLNDCVVNSQRLAQQLAQGFSSD